MCGKEEKANFLDIESITVCNKSVMFPFCGTELRPQMEINGFMPL